jgi:hypothetical protein
MKKLIIVCVIALASITANAQYKWGIGAAIGSPTGLSLKVFTAQTQAFDFTLGFWNDYTNISAMYEIHNSFNDLGSLNTYKNQLTWYYGPGAHIGSWNSNHYAAGESHTNSIFLGVDGVIGTEWKAPEIPLAISLDIRPGINLIGGVGFFLQSELGVRYTF